METSYEDEDDIAAVRQVRHEISEECNHDVDKVIACYRTIQEELKRSGEFRFSEDTPTDAAILDSSDNART